ncbi:hypothetical protein Y032_0956g3207 [Ancylostoma ceylanicum]|uniref:Uncharacterized protein n=1 Tax=Ancylostoma ceylanicum TaxID=53326 RepID=A0A016W8I5_9BILA|nr:hypothetical protein Y032_0956g3207 [Ancylostoma ceylanicum]
MCSTGWHTWCDAWNRVLNRSSTNACSRNPPPCPTGALCRERKVANVVSKIDIQKIACEGNVSVRNSNSDISE